MCQHRHAKVTIRDRRQRRLRWDCRLPKRADIQHICLKFSSYWVRNAIARLPAVNPQMRVCVRNRFELTKMQLRLKNQNEVRLFSAAITVTALSFSILLQFFMLPAAILDQVLFTSSVITIMVMTPITYFVGLKIQDVSDLTVQLEHAVNHDTLTGTCTRLSFYRRLSEMDDLPLVIIAADIDHFKKINDKYGHKAGDGALKQFANTLSRNSREEDVIARFGGEEFVVLLQGMSLEDGVVTAQRLCDQVRKKVFIAEGQQMRLTASFGVAEASSISEVDYAIHQADLAAYRAKRDGRDRVYTYNPELDKDITWAETAT